MTYKSVYSFNVIDEVEEGTIVYCLDRQEKEVLTINDLHFGFALGVIQDAKNNDRYEFWKEIKEDA